MSKTYCTETILREWLRSVMDVTLGNNPDATHYFYLPVKQIENIVIEEVYRYLMQHRFRAPRQTTADICDVNVKTVSRTINNFSK